MRRKNFRVFLEAVLKRLENKVNHYQFFNIYNELNQGQLEYFYTKTVKEETKRAIGLLYPVYLVKNSNFNENIKENALRIYWEAFIKVYTESKINWFNKNIENYPPYKDEKINNYGKRILYNVHIMMNDLKEDKHGWLLLDDYCPGLEACEIFKLDTREICKIGFSEQYQVLLDKVSEHYNNFFNIKNGKKLLFCRNYNEIRSLFSDCTFCKEKIEVLI